jgi:hypothetical protein
MAEGLDFEALWPVPPGRFGWSARGNAPCVMEIVSWLTVGAIDLAIVLAPSSGDTGRVKT